MIMFNKGKRVFREAMQKGWKTDDEKQPPFKGDTYERAWEVLKRMQGRR